MRWLAELVLRIVMRLVQQVGKIQQGGMRIFGVLDNGFGEFSRLFLAYLQNQGTIWLVLNVHILFSLRTAFRGISI